MDGGASGLLAHLRGALMTLSRTQAFQDRAEPEHSCEEHKGKN